MISSLVILAVIYTLYETYYGSAIIKPQVPVRQIPLNLPDHKIKSSTLLTTNSSIPALKCYVCESYSNFDDNNLTNTYGPGPAEAGRLLISSKMNLTISSQCLQPIGAITHVRPNFRGRGARGREEPYKISTVKVLNCPKFSSCATLRYYHEKKGQSFQRICYNDIQTTGIGCHKLGNVVAPSSNRISLSESRNGNSNNSNNGEVRYLPNGLLGRTSVKIDRLVPIKILGQRQRQGQGQAQGQAQGQGQGQGQSQGQDQDQAQGQGQGQGQSQGQGQGPGQGQGQGQGQGTLLRVRRMPNAELNSTDADFNAFSDTATTTIQNSALTSTPYSSVSDLASPATSVAFEAMQKNTTETTINVDGTTRTDANLSPAVTQSSRPAQIGKTWKTGFNVKSLQELVNQVKKRFPNISLPRIKIISNDNRQNGKGISNAKTLEGPNEIWKNAEICICTSSLCNIGDGNGNAPRVGVGKRIVFNK